jgi:hypothetical protein
MRLTRYRAFHSTQPVLKSHWAASVTPARDALVALCVSTALAPKFNERCSRDTVNADTARETGEERLRTTEATAQTLCRSGRSRDHWLRSNSLGRLQKSVCQFNCGKVAPAALHQGGHRGARNPTGIRCRSACSHRARPDVRDRNLGPAQDRRRERQATGAP